MSGEHIRGIPRTYEKEITLADTPYTLSVGFNCVKVDTTGGNVRVNLPNVNYPIDVIKTSSDSYIVTVWVSGVQIGEVCGELSKITIENAEVTKDEPWYPYDAIVGIAGVSGDGGEVLAKDRFGRVIAGGRGVAGTDDATVINNAVAFEGHVHVSGVYTLGDEINISDKIIHLSGDGPGKTILQRVGHVLRCTNTSVLINDSNSHNLQKVSGMLINGINKTGYGLLTKWINNSMFLDNVVIRNCSAGIYNRNCVLSIRDSVIESCTIGINLEGTIATDPTVGVMGSCLYAQNSRIDLNGTGVYASQLAKMLFSNCAMEANISRAIFMIGETDYHPILTAIGTTVEANAYHDSNDLIYCTANGVISYLRPAVHLVGCSFIPNSKNTNIINVVDCPRNRLYGCNLGSGSGVSGIILTGGGNVIDGFSVSYPAPHAYNQSLSLTLGVGSIVCNVDTYRTENFGSSTGTGSEQSIPHGLAAIPVGCKAWIKIEYPVGSGRYITKDIPYDVTYVYPTVDNGVAFEWGIE